MLRLVLFCVIAAAALLGGNALAEGADGRRPNVVLIITDDK